MPRTKPVYTYSFSSSAPLKEERHSHRMKGKGTAPRGSTRPPVSMPRVSAGFDKETPYGSHKRFYGVLETTRKEWGL